MDRIVASIVQGRCFWARLPQTFLARNGAFAAARYVKDTMQVCGYGIQLSNNGKKNVGDWISGAIDNCAAA